MFQQTSISSFFKSVNPKSSQVSKKHEINKQSEANLKRKPRGYGRLKKEPPMPLSQNKASNKIQSPSLIESVELKAEPTSPKTPTSSRNVHSSPTSSDKKSLKRSNSGRSLSSSPRKKNQSNGSRSVTKHLKNRSPRRLFKNETPDAAKVSEMVENMNLSRTGLLPKTDINLEKFYSQLETNSKEEVFVVDVDQIKPVYDINRVVIPREKHAEHLFEIFTQVFSYPVNCGYFNDQELDMVFRILCLSDEAQSLLARMIRRKVCWKRAKSIEYPMISKDLRPYFDELERQKLITSDLGKESLEEMLTMLLVDEVRDICRQSNISKQGNKDSAIKKLLENSSIKPLFPGMESPAVALRKKVLNMLDHCVCVQTEVISLISRVVLLFIPSEDATSKFSDIFLKLTMIKEGTMKYPEIPLRHYPIFQNREHLIRCVERRNEWKQAQEMPRGDKENWEILKTLGRNAHTRLMQLLEENQSSQQKFLSTPKHVRKFREEYVCIKIVTTCLEIFKKENSTVKEAVDMLGNLISQEIYLQGRKGEWYEELALIEMKHKKDLKAAALLIIEGLNLRNITDAGKHLLTKRASTLAKRKSGIDTDIKSQLINLIDIKTDGNTPTVSINANAMQGNKPGRKSIWSMDIGGGDKGYMSVEHRAQCYYKNNGFPEGWHCEGSLPVTLFTLLFWDELYHVPVPAAYLSAYQTAPLDLFTSDFYNNRKERLDNKIAYIESLSSDQLGDLIEEFMETRQHYTSLMPASLHLSSEGLRDVVRCMGTSVVVGICKKLALNFSGCRAGFPDLLVWNPMTLKCKFVEVKGPGDTLSAKQTLWLRYLDSLGAVTELCEVKGEEPHLYTTTYIDCYSELRNQFFL